MSALTQAQFMVLPTNRQAFLLFTAMQNLTTGHRAVGAIRKKTVTNTWGALASVACTSVVISNTTGKIVNYRRGGSGEYISIPDGSGKEIDVAANANELQIQNGTDTASIDVKYECNGEVV